MNKRNERLIISLGSNYNQRENIDFAKKQLAVILAGNVVFSKEIWTEPVGIVSDKFINCLCVSTTHHTLTQTRLAFKRIEKTCGRTKKNDKLNRIPLDIDILMYGGEQYHTDDWNRPYIQKLMDDFDEEKKKFILDPTVQAEPKQ